MDRYFILKEDKQNALKQFVGKTIKEITVIREEDDTEDEVKIIFTDNSLCSLTSFGDYITNICVETK